MSMTNTSRTTGGDVLVEVMKKHGIDTAFGVISVHNLPLVEAVARDLRFVEMRHEAACVSAADGYARATGKIGIAITSTGTGAGNAAGSMIEALTAGSRVLHITGQVDSEYVAHPRGVIHEFPAQLDMLTAISKHAARVESVTQCRQVLEDAIAHIERAPSGPASVEWPSDLQYLAEPDDQAFTPLEMPALPHPDQADLERAAGLLRAARRPMFWLGGGAASAAEPLTELAERLGAAVVTSNSGRAVVREDNELVIGNFGSDPGTADLLGQADLMLAVGTHFRSNETKSYALKLPATSIAVDVDAAALGRVYPCDVGLHGDAGAVIEDLLALVPDSATEPGWRDKVVTTRNAVRGALDEAIGGYSDICTALNELPEGSIVARDVTIPSSQWGNRLLRFVDRRSNIFPLGGGIGQGLGMAIGASVGRPDVPTIAFVGDGGLAVHLGELGALVQSGARCTVLVFNDCGYGVLRNMQKANGFAEVACDLATPDFAKLAESYGMPFWRADGATPFAEVLGAAVNVAGPAMVEVVIDKLDPSPRPFTPPVHVPSKGAHHG
ncbi:thiamine pyrophosphate-binding protein [Enemella sp. A6]|uniref:thiamine pyrophosphate-binding protein n=1 Tax=Enemella sp. A6 TaxID=3440152 RepID=UPI003EBB80E7